MDTHELLIRTINAAKEAREMGFENTAECFDEIVESLLDFMKSSTEIQHEDA